MHTYNLSQSQLQQVYDKTDYYIELANKNLSLQLSSIDVKFDLKGRTSGMFVVKRNETCIRYNEIIFSRYFDDSLENTVAHEVAHYVVHSMHVLRKVKPHGEEWQRVMNLFGVKPEVTSNYDVSSLPLHRQKQHDYYCECMTHQLSTTRHNKVQANRAVYKCRKCLQSLRWNSLSL